MPPRLSPSLLYEMAELIRAMAKRMAVQDRKDLAKDAELAATAMNFLHFNGFVEPKKKRGKA
jgi:hypothetical protein